jgi:hypothetical protein
MLDALADMIIKIVHVWLKMHLFIHNIHTSTIPVRCNGSSWHNKYIGDNQISLTERHRSIGTSLFQTIMAWSIMLLPLPPLPISSTRSLGICSQTQIEPHIAITCSIHSAKGVDWPSPTVCVCGPYQMGDPTCQWPLVQAWQVREFQQLREGFPLS